jgi:hypothetical protein
MKVKLLVAATILAASGASAWAANCGDVACGSGFTGSDHDWTRAAITAGTSGANTGSYVTGSGGTTGKAFYSLASGAPVVASAADVTAGMFYVPAAGVTVLGTLVGDGATKYTVQVNSTTAPVTTNTAGTSFGTVRLMLGQCTKCHTPHVAKQTSLLWNHTLNTGTYNWDEPATTAGTPYAKFKGDTYKGSTSKCLSCHDGTIGGSDGVWFNNAFLSGDSRGTSATGIAQGLKLNKTHPVAMPYPYGNAPNVYNGTTTGPAAILSEWVAAPTGVRLYNDADGLGTITAGAVAGKTGIECNSCHDVHNGKTTVVDSYLLRGNLTGSTNYICQKCHQK